MHLQIKALIGSQLSRQNICELFYKQHSHIWYKKYIAREKSKELVELSKIARKREIICILRQLLGLHPCTTNR